MLFDKAAHKYCAYCQHSRDFDAEYVLCEKKGPISPDSCCHAFRYDPLRRLPHLPRPRLNLSEDAFKL